MAGMLPGVETARRRRIHQGGGSFNSSRRPGFCLYTTSLEPHLNSATCFSAQRCSLSKEFYGGDLEDVAREAKERLDERLRTRKSSEIIIRHKSMGNVVHGEGANNIQREVFSLKKSSKKFSWSKLGWKAMEQKDCAVCLDNFKTGDILVHLPCAHKFHWNCVMPWIETSYQCPCCRTPVSS